MVDPVRTVDGNVYEREAISRWLQQRRTSPMTNMRLPSLVLTEDRALRAAIEESARGSHLHPQLIQLKTVSNLPESNTKGTKGTARGSRAAMT